MSSTESASLYDRLETLSIGELLRGMNAEDQKPAQAVAAALPALEALVASVAARMATGGRLFYIGAGTSGRLGILDASECPPTFGIDPSRVIGLIAGGDRAIRTSVENAEDDTGQGWKDLQQHGVTPADCVIGIAASGRTPYVLGALQACKAHAITTGCIVCNTDTPIAAVADHAVELLTGPEFLTGSTRLKAGTAQKMALNMLSTAVMIRLGLVRGNRMVNMQLSNAKLVARGTAMVQDATGLDENTARTLLLAHGTARAAIDAFTQP